MLFRSATYLDALQTNQAKITSITQDAPASSMTLTGAQYANDQAALGKITGGYTATVNNVTAANAASVAGNSSVTALTVRDTAANIAANIDALQTHHAKITSTTQTDAGTPLAITGTQVTNDADALADITPNTYTVQASGTFSASDAITLITANSHVAVTISDTAANIVSNLADLVTNRAQITSITQSNAGALNVSYAQATDADTTTTLNKINSGTYTLNVSGVSAANVSSLAANTKVTSMLVTDTSANIATNLDALQTNQAKITSITQSGTPAALDVTYSQVTKIGRAHV